MLREKIRTNPESECLRIERFIKDKIQKLGRKGVLLGLSGGIDSAVVAFLSVRAVGPEYVNCVFMPEKHTSRDSGKHARLVATQLGVKYKIHNITSKLNNFGFYRFVPGNITISLIRKALLSVVRSKDDSSFESGLGKSNNKFIAQANAFYRIKPRMRMMVLYEQSEREDLLVVGTANRSEYDIGLYASHGCDDAVDIMPVRHLLKTQIIQIAHFLDIPREIIEKPPSPDFIPGMTDEGIIGLSYEILDLILLGLESGYSATEISSEIGCTSSDID
ncbi:unnamed protein product, partial [marine sediment metagenome]